jgi:hypothetical protein
MAIRPADAPGAVKVFTKDCRFSISPPGVTCAFLSMRNVPAGAVREDFLTSMPAAKLSTE